MAEKMEPDDGIDWDTLTIGHLGSDADDGTTLTDEVTLRMREVAEAVVDEKRTGRGRVIVTIDVELVGGRAVVVRPSIAVKMPGRKRPPSTGVVSRSRGLISQEGRQLDVADAIRAAQGEVGR